MKETKRGQVWYCDFSPVVGSEQGGIRPCVVIQNDIGNRFAPTTIVALITKQDKLPYPTHVPLSVPFLREPSMILLEQIRTVSKIRLMDCVGDVSRETLDEIDMAIKKSVIGV